MNESLTYRLNLVKTHGETITLLYRPHVSELLWADTRQPLSLAPVGMTASPAAARAWPAARTVSPQTPLVKSPAPRALKIQMGLKCNARCGYCNQTARPAESHGNPAAAERFLAGMESWFKPAEPDGKNLRIEFWGGEPLIYRKTLELLATELRRRYPQALFSIVTNGSVLDDAIIDFLDRLDFGVAVSHDGPGQIANRGFDPFDDTHSAANLRKLHDRLTPKGAISYNCVLTAEHPSLIAVRDYLAGNLGCSPEQLLLSTEELVLPYENTGLAQSPADAAAHARLRNLLFREIAHGSAIHVLNVKEKIHDFYQSLAQRRPAETLWVRCGMDREDALAVDLNGDALTCQNTAAGDGHRLGNVADFSAIRLHTAYHWARREECPRCPVVQLCKGACMRLEDQLWRQACDNSYTYNLALLAAALYLLTGATLVSIEGDLRDGNSEGKLNVIAATPHTNIE
ncbi:MAG: SPASM domain-containing protein [Sulfuricella sp.]|nr:SPASM domain-containing protein [Sulfuricella sp.]